MKPASSLLLLLLFLPCAHGTRGESKPVDLDVVARAHLAAGKLFQVAIERVNAADPLETGFDAGLPACRFGETRRVKIEPVPKALVGKRIWFGREAKGDLWVVTMAKRLGDVTAGVLASGELASRLGVRCVPAMVTVRSETEVDVAEE